MFHLNLLPRQMLVSDLFTKHLTDIDSLCPGHSNSKFVRDSRIITVPKCQRCQQDLYKHDERLYCKVLVHGRIYKFKESTKDKLQRKGRQRCANCNHPRSKHLSGAAEFTRRLLAYQTHHQQPNPKNVLQSQQCIGKYLH